MEKIINNPGLQHLVEKVFFNLNVEDLEICAQINQSCKQILENPMFWLRKFGGRLSQKNQNEWIQNIQSEENSKKRKDIMAYLQWNSKKEASKYIPCYTSPDVQDDFKKKIMVVCKKQKSSEEDIEIVKILAPLTDNPNASDVEGNTPIYTAAIFGHTEIVNILAPLTNVPNAPVKNGWTPIYWAARNGHTEVVRILASMTTDYLNTPDKDGWTPICWAAYGQHTEIVKILTHLVAGNPNVPICMSIKCCQKYTSCSVSIDTEIQRILQSSPNYPRKRKASWTITKDSQENM